MIDSELVPWGKGEKQAGEADEIEPETIRLQGLGARKGDEVPIEEWANEFMYIAKSKDYGPEAKRKRVLKARLLPIAKRKSFYYDVR